MKRFSVTSRRYREQLSLILETILAILAILFPFLHSSVVRMAFGSRMARISRINQDKEGFSQPRGSPAKQMPLILNILDILDILDILLGFTEKRSTTGFVDNSSSLLR